MCLRWSQGRPESKNGSSFGNDTLSYFTERLDPRVSRQAALTAVREAKRHKAFDDCRFIGLTLDGTGAGRSQEKVCNLCRPQRNEQREILGYHVLVVWLLTCLALTLERLYRIRYLHRGTHPILEAAARALCSHGARR